MTIGQIEQWAEGLLVVAVVPQEDKESSAWHCLHHLFCAVKIFDQLKEEDRKVCQNVIKLTKSMFFSKFTLKGKKERKRNKEKKIPTPQRKEEKEKEEKKVQTHTHEKENFAPDFESRKEEFRLRVMAFKGVYDDSLLHDFFDWFSETNKSGNKMRFESRKYFNIENRLARWKNNHITSDNESASIRLETTKKKHGKETKSMAEQQVVAAVREAADAQREKEIEESKAGQMLTDEYLAQNPNGFLAQVARERKQREAKRRENPKTT